MFGSTIRTFETFEYSIVGNRVSRTDRKGKEWTFSYDVLNRMTQKTHEDGRKVSYAYDDLGRLTSADNGVRATYTYNPLGRITTAALDDKSVQYTYDAAGNRASITLGNTNIQYTYDALNRLKQIKDSAGNVIFADYTYAYGNDGNPTVTAALANQTIQRVIKYNAVDWVREITTTVAGESRTGFAYTYDAVGNQTRKTVRGNAQSFTYNTIIRLTQADFPGGFPFAEPSFAYDPAGNRTSADTGTALQYDINAMNQYTQVGNAAYAWDANGNLTNDGTDAYTYDVENRLTRFQSIQFTYDAAGRLITRSNAVGVVSQYVYDFNGIIAEYNAAGDLTRRYIRRPDTGELVAAINGPTYYYVTDALGSPAEILDPTGALVERNAYDAYGHVSMTGSSGDPLEASTFGNPFFFAGMLQDPIGLYAAGNRFYSPDIGRFIQAGPYDSYGNAYTYANNNPTSNTPDAGFMLPSAQSGLFGGSLDIAKGDHAPSDMPWSDALAPNPNRPNLCGTALGTAFPALVPVPTPMKGLVPEPPAPEVRVD